MKFRHLIFGMFTLSLVLILFFCTREPKLFPFQTTGIKIGEVTDSSAIIWTRLTKNPSRVDTTAPMPVVLYKDPETGKLEKKEKGRPDTKPVVQFPKGSNIETIEGAVPGAPGEVRVLYRPDNISSWYSTDWQAVDPQKDFTRQFTLSHLQPDQEYFIRVECRDEKKKEPGQTVDGHFRTAPKPEEAERVVFTVTTGQAYNDMDIPGRGYKIYPEMLKLHPDFFVHTGDIVYYDRLAKTKALALWHWARTYSLPTNVEFHRQVSSYFIKDDHDTWMNDCWPGMQTNFMGNFTFKEGQEIFLEEVPMGKSTVRTFRWGKDLQIWLPEGRDFRSPNTMPDGPEKTIWGQAQKDWFKRTVQESDATFRILISPTPLVGPDRDKKHDNHSNRAFQHEGDELRQFISQQKNMFVVCGDRHWQYVSVDLKTGLREYCCGPASNQHAGGWKNEYRRPEHQYLNVTGGFLAVTIDRLENKPVAIFRHYSVEGKVLHEDILRQAQDD